MTIVPIRFPDDLYDKLQALAHVEGTSMARLVREAIKEKIKRLPQKKKKRLSRDPFVEFIKRVEKIPAKKYYHPELTDDELLYGQAR